MNKARFQLPFSAASATGHGISGMCYVSLPFFVANLIGRLFGLTLIARKQIYPKSRFAYDGFPTVGTYVAIFGVSWILQRRPGT